MKYDPKAGRGKLSGISMRVVLALVVVSLLVVPIAVQADLVATAVVYAWDSVVDKFQNSNVIIPWDGTWIPFLHELNFDDDRWADAGVCGYDPANPDSTGTQWAGNMYYGLYHVDNAPLGAPGFQESRLWSLIDCDRDGSGTFGPGDLTDVLSPYDRGVVYAECLPAAEGGTYCVVEPVDKDVVMACTTGNCQSEIVTTIRVNLDLDCDGAVDPELGVGIDARTGEPELLCFYAQARTPTVTEQAGLVWSNPLQARISTVGGDKTVNFSFAPTAVELASFEASAQGNGVLLTWETASEIDNLGFHIYRADSRVGQLIKITPTLIAGKNPGSAVGAAYSFLDESVVPGTTYYYWLEDIDTSGGAAKNGPVVARMAAGKALPGRPRPAPMPGNAF